VYLKLEPNSVLAYRSIAYGNLIEKQFAQSVEAYKKIASLDTMEFDDYRWLGTAYKQLKKDSLAAATWKEALKDTAQSVALRSYLYGEVGSYYMSSRQYEQASEYFLKRYHVDTTAVASMINYAKCIMEMKEFDKAVSALQEAITRYPKYPGAHISLGFCYAQMKDYDLSRKEFETAVKLIDTTDSKFSKYDLADSYRMIALSIMVEKKTTPEESKKKWEDAVIYLKKSLKYNEGVAQTHLWLGQCFQNLNKLDDAIKEYKRTIQLDPKNDEAKKYLADLLKLKGD
jgi:tetratricopeptide (TPR) repeat protein